MSGLSISSCHEGDDSQRVLDVLFFHGLGGDSISTWHPKNISDAFWPNWLAGDRPDAAVWTIGYPAEMTKWTGHGSGMALPARGKQILDYVVNLGFGRRPIVFVAHSLGGLVVKQILRSATELRVKRYQPISTMTRGVVFLATPHKGSSLSGLARGLRFLRETQEVKDLEANSPYLEDLADWYRNNAPDLEISSYSYRENRLLAGKFWVVEPSSADPGIAGALCIPQDEDHFSIAKPPDTLHPVYVGVSSMLAAISQLEQERNTMKIELDDLTLSVPQPAITPVELSTFATKKGLLYQNVELGFQFGLPGTSGWSEPTELNRSEFLSRMGLDDELIKRTLAIMCAMPLGRMMAESKYTAVFHGEPLVAELTEDTTTKALEKTLEGIRKLAEEEGSPLDDEDIQDLRFKFVRQNIPVDQLNFQNHFAVSTMRKELARESPVLFNLPTVFLITAQSMAMPIDDLTAIDKSILWSSSQTVRNVEVAGELREITGNTLNLLTDSKDMIYLVSVYYSRQTEDSLAVWDQLERMLRSFKILLA